MSEGVIEIEKCRPVGWAWSVAYPSKRLSMLMWGGPHPMSAVSIRIDEQPYDRWARGYGWSRGSAERRARRARAKWDARRKKKAERTTTREVIR